ncbi:hypothetical protein PM082_020879 [Marasmius tenuissimus]|nr:hypothetical protein PM082_020879 [Marasmius tenuissimus]
MGRLAFDFENTFGVLALTAFVSSFLAGITTIQTYIYIVNYQKDPLHMKIFVSPFIPTGPSGGFQRVAHWKTRTRQVTVVWTLAMLHAVLLMMTTWHYLVESFGNPLLLIVRIHWSALVRAPSLLCQA